MKKILIILCLLQSVCMAMEFDKNGNYEMEDGIIINDGVFRKKLPVIQYDKSNTCRIPGCTVYHNGITHGTETAEIKTNIEPTFDQKIDILKNEIEQLKKQIQELKSNERK